MNERNERPVIDRRIEECAKAGYYAMIDAYLAKHPGVPVPGWEQEPEELRVDWRLAARMVVITYLETAYGEADRCSLGTEADAACVVPSGG